MRADADWLLQAQLPDGAIGHYVDRVKIWPYLANEAATGLAQATKVTGDTKYVSAVWSWLKWYQAHEDVNGFVTDYTVSGGVETSTGDMDSTDAYAGTFLMAARKVWKVSGDTATLVKGIESTPGVAQAAALPPARGVTVVSRIVSPLGVEKSWKQVFSVPWSDIDAAVRPRTV